MKTIRLTTAQAVVKFLNQQYIEVDNEKTPFVKGIFHIFGHGNVLGLGQALEEDPGHLELIQGKNEQGMAQAAIAYGKEKLRRQIFAVTTSVGPGAANLVTAAGTALANNIPVLFLPGDTFASRQPDPVLQQVEQEQSAAITTNDALKPLSRYWDRITRPEQVMSALIRAFEVLTDPSQGGPVTVALSQDVEGEAYDFPEEFFKERVHYLDRRMPSQRELLGAAELIKSSKYPVIVVGGGAKYSGAGEILKKIALDWNIPLVETQAGKSTVTSDFTHNLGGVGVTGTLSANKAAQQADLVIGVGTRYTDFTSSSKSAFDVEKANFLNINVSRMQTYKFDGFQVVADAKAALEELYETVSDYKSEFNDTIQSLRDEWYLERNRLAHIDFSDKEITPEVSGHFDEEKLNQYAKALGTRLPQTTALLAFNDWIAPESVVVGASGSLPGDMQRVWDSKTPNTYNMEYGYSTMGYEVAGALGAKIAHPHQEVYGMVGDGSFHMLHSEFVTSIQYNQKINLMLFDNSGFGSINNLQMNNGSPTFGTEFERYDHQPLTIDFAKAAEAYGGKGYTVSTVEELLEALEDAKKQEVSTLIHIKVLPKTMTEGYESWWNTGVAETTKKGYTKPSLETKETMLKKAKKY